MHPQSQEFQLAYLEKQASENGKYNDLNTMIGRKKALTGRSYRSITGVADTRLLEKNETVEVLDEDYGRESTSHIAKLNEIEAVVDLPRNTP